MRWCVYERERMRAPNYFACFSELFPPMPCHDTTELTCGNSAAKSCRPSKLSGPCVDHCSKMGGELITFPVVLWCSKLLSVALMFAGRGVQSGSSALHSKQLAHSWSQSPWLTWHPSSSLRCMDPLYLAKSPTTGSRKIFACHHWDKCVMSSAAVSKCFLRMQIRNVAAPSLASLFALEWLDTQVCVLHAAKRIFSTPGCKLGLSYFGTFWSAATPTSIEPALWFNIRNGGLAALLDDGIQAMEIQEKWCRTFLFRPQAEAAGRAQSPCQLPPGQLGYQQWLRWGLRLPMLCPKSATLLYYRPAKSPPSGSISWSWPGVTYFGPPPCSHASIWVQRRETCQKLRISIRGRPGV